MIKDEVMQAIQKLDWPYKNFFIGMMVAEDDTVEIIVQDTEAMQEYRQLIDLNLIKGH